MTVHRYHDLKSLLLSFSLKAAVFWRPSYGIPALKLCCLVRAAGKASPQGCTIVPVCMLEACKRADIDLAAASWNIDKLWFSQGRRNRPLTRRSPLFG